MEMEMEMEMKMKIFRDSRKHTIEDILNLLEQNIDFHKHTPKYSLADPDYVTGLKRAKRLIQVFQTTYERVDKIK